MNFKTLALTTALIATAATGAMAQSVVTETYTETAIVPGVNQVQFSKFDVNLDGKYSMPEVGETLFYMFDTDGNEVIDNLEWNNKNVMTIIPIEETTFQYIDANGDGMADMQINSYNEFYTESGLMAFDKNKDGLSAREFIGEGFEVLDDDEDKVITLEEWQEVYLDSQAEHDQPENYNNGEKG